MQVSDRGETQPLVPEFLHIRTESKRPPPEALDETIPLAPLAAAAAKAGPRQERMLS